MRSTISYQCDSNALSAGTNLLPWTERQFIKGWIRETDFMLSVFDVKITFTLTATQHVSAAEA